ncbi:MAG: 2OG-Fe(II) oxygenase [Gammaproteobacteria bacterium]|nr:2OG-Fe(II) oxygenase [Gammaproteobacteria bacterium]
MQIDNEALDEQGYVVLPRLLDASTCLTLIADYSDEVRFRSRIVMARHNFGRGEYQYFDYPLPPVVQRLREALYEALAPIATAWATRMSTPTRYPKTLQAYLSRCHRAGQKRPTPLMLKYGPDDYNCLHQDLYGDAHFPLQVAALLSRPGEDFTGGELILTQQRPRMQSRASVVPLQRGDAVAFAVNDRPVAGTRGDYRVKMRHGVSTVTDGERYVLGLIFHDAT